MPPEYVRKQYQKTLNDPGKQYYFSLILDSDYEYLLSPQNPSKTRVIGIWDDHDYGSNNADHTLHTKYVQRQLFLDFIGEPMDTERRLNNERGLY